MRPNGVLGVVIFLAGLFLLYLLRGLFLQLIVLVLGFLGIVVAFTLMAVGLGLIVFSRRFR